MAVYFKNSYKSDGAALPLSVKMSGFSNAHPATAGGAGVRDHYLIHYVVSGRGTFTAAGRAFPVRAGEVFLVWPNVVVSYEADTESPWEYYWLGFSGPDAAACWRARTCARTRPCCTSTSGGRSSATSPQSTRRAASPRGAGRDAGLCLPAARQAHRGAGRPRGPRRRHRPRGGLYREQLRRAHHRRRHRLPLPG